MAVVPLPSPDEVDLVPPDAAEVQATTDAISALVAPGGAPTDLQRVLIEALFPAMTGHAVVVGPDAPSGAPDIGEVLRRRNLAFRTRIVQTAVLCALVLRPLPAEVAARIEEVARRMGVDEGMVAVARRFAAGALGLAAADFERNGYTATWSPDDTAALHTSSTLGSAWDVTVRDEALAARWDALADLPDGTLGRATSRLYEARGFEVPGRPGSAPPLLAQHDWVHVLADYGTTVEAELEVFALIARANDDMRAFSLLAMVVSLFETGYLRAGAGLFESAPGHLSAGGEVARRVADAMRRGALLHDGATGSDSVDLLRVDWFAIADRPIDEVRRRFSLTPKSEAARAAGSVGPWEPGGISPFQVRSGQEAAARAGRTYGSFGASALA